MGQMCTYKISFQKIKKKLFMNNYVTIIVKREKKFNYENYNSINLKKFNSKDINLNKSYISMFCKTNIYNPLTYNDIS